MASAKTSILFLCTGNSARSIMAEAIANQQFGKHIEACSAGSRPKGAVHPLALKTLEKNGLKTQGLSSKSWEQFAGREFHAVITLCDSARAEACPVFPGAPAKIHWNLPDPPASPHAESMFEGVFDALVDAIGCLVHAPDPEIVGRGRQAARVVSQRFSPRAV